MTLRWDWFFEPGTRVLALPSWRRPRLYVPARPFLRRWDGSGMYPASRLTARAYRAALRTSVVAGARTARVADSEGWAAGEFVRGVLPNVAYVVVLVGTPGPAQKTTARLSDAKGRVLGYLKYAEKRAARRRLRQERDMLRRLPPGVGPEPMKFGEMGRGEALLSSALPGRSLPATLPPPEGVVGLLGSLGVSRPKPVADHPWARRVQADGWDGLESCLEEISGREWPVVVRHGDFAPWNLLRGPDGALGAIDWEYGTPEGLPYLDLAYYLLQVSALIYRQAPERAARRAIRHLTQNGDTAPSRDEARALVRLAAYEAYSNAREDGQPESAGLQGWRRKVWEGAYAS